MQCPVALLLDRLPGERTAKGQIANILGSSGQEAKSKVSYTYLYNKRKTNFHKLLIDKIQNIIIVKRV